MARRATPVTKGRTSPKKSGTTPRSAGGAKSKPQDDLPMEASEETKDMQPMFAGVDEPAPEPEAPPSAKTRRGRKPKSDMATADMDGIAKAAPVDAAPVDAALAVEPELDLVEPQLPEPEPESSAPPSSPRKTRRNREPEASAPPPLETAEESPAEASAPAATWHPESGTVTFDWTAIEQVAASEGANQIMAKLLLAARAEGATSRWPF